MILNHAISQHMAPRKAAWLLARGRVGSQKCVRVHKLGNVMGYTIVAPSGGGRTIYKTEYWLSDTYIEKQVTAEVQGRAGIATTTSYYDANGNRTRIQEVDHTNHDVSTRTIDYDVNHVALVKSETKTNSATVVTRNLIANGELIGTNSADALRDLANPYESVNATSLSSGPSVYNAQGGESWQSIAKTVWGDSKLWYLIADANGAAAIQPGAAIKIPPRVNTINNDAHTFKPYDPSQLVGNTTPGIPAPPGGEPCGGFGQIITSLVAIVVTVAASFVLPVVGAAIVGNIAGQIAGNVIGVQDGFSFKSVALAAVSAGVTYGVSNTGLFAGNVIAQAAVANALTQGVAVVTGLQKSFDWRGVVASGIGAGVGEFVGGKLGGENPVFGQSTAGEIGRGLVSSFAAGAATAIARGGRVSVVQVATDAFGNALGQAIGGALRPSENQSQAETNRLARYEKEAVLSSKGQIREAPFNFAGQLPLDSIPFKSANVAAPDEFIDNYSRQAQGYGENPDAPIRSLTSYSVQRGDTLSGIAGGDLGQVGLIAAENRLRGSNIRAGQQLVYSDIGDYSTQAQGDYGRIGASIYAQDQAATAPTGQHRNTLFPNDDGTGSDYGLLQRASERGTSPSFIQNKNFATYWAKQIKEGAELPTLIPRGQWEKIPLDVAELSKNPFNGEYTKITLHHTGSRSTPEEVEALHRGEESKFSKFGRNAKSILTQGKLAQRYGNADVGYNFLIAPNGSIYEGRSLEYIPAHVSGNNPGNVGIAFLGDYTSKPLTTNQVSSSEALIKTLNGAYGINTKAQPSNYIFTHGQFDAVKQDELKGALPQIEGLKKRVYGSK